MHKMGRVLALLEDSRKGGNQTLANAITKGRTDKTTKLWLEQMSGAAPTQKRRRSLLDRTNTRP